MIRRAEQGPAEPAARDVGKIAFQWFGLRDLDRVEIVPGAGKGRAFENAPVGGDRAGFTQLEKLRTFRHREPHVVALRLFQEQPRQGENGIGQRRGFDLGDHILESAAVRQKTNGYRQRLGRRFGTGFALRPVVAGAIWAGARTASIAFRAFIAAVRLPRAAPVAVPVPWTIGTAVSSG